MAFLAVNIPNLATVRTLERFNPSRGHPLRFPLQAVYLTQQLVVGAFCVIVYYNHVKEVAVLVFHFSRLLNYVLQFLLLKHNILYFLFLETVVKLNLFLNV